MEIRADGARRQHECVEKEKSFESLLKHIARSIDLPPMSRPKDLRYFVGELADIVVDTSRSESGILQWIMDHPLWREPVSRQQALNILAAVRDYALFSSGEDSEEEYELDGEDRRSPGGATGVIRELIPLPSGFFGEEPDMMYSVPLCGSRFIFKSVLPPVANYDPASCDEDDASVGADDDGGYDSSDIDDNPVNF